MNRDQKRQRAVGRNQLANQPGGLIAIKQFVIDLQMRVAQGFRVQRFTQMRHDVAHVAKLILPGQA